MINKHVYKYENYLRVQIRSNENGKNISKNIPLDSSENTIKKTLRELLVKAGNTDKEIEYKMSDLKKEAGKKYSQATARSTSGFIGVNTQINASKITFLCMFNKKKQGQFCVTIRSYTPEHFWVNRNELVSALTEAINLAESLRGTNRVASELIKDEDLQRITNSCLEAINNNSKRKTVKEIFLANSIKDMEENHLKRALPKEVNELNKWLKSVKHDRESLVHHLRKDGHTEKNIRRFIDGKTILSTNKKQRKPNKFGYIEIVGTALKDRISYRYTHNTSQNANDAEHSAYLNNYIDDLFWVKESELKRAFAVACRDRDIAAGEATKTEQEYIKLYNTVDWAEQYSKRGTIKNIHVVESLEELEKNIIVRIPDSLGTKVKNRIKKNTNKENRAGYIGLMLNATAKKVSYCASVYKNETIKRGESFSVELQDLTNSTQWLAESDLKKAYLMSCKDYDTLKGIEVLEDEEYLYAYVEVDWLEIKRKKCLNQNIKKIIVAKDKQNAITKLKAG